jgi:hypothetical protein
VYSTAAGGASRRGLFFSKTYIQAERERKRKRKRKREREKRESEIDPYLLFTLSGSCTQAWNKAPSSSERTTE